MITFLNNVWLLRNLFVSLYQNMLKRDSSFRISWYLFKKIITTLVV